MNEYYKSDFIKNLKAPIFPAWTDADGIKLAVCWEESCSASPIFILTNSLSILQPFLRMWLMNWATQTEGTGQNSSERVAFVQPSEAHCWSSTVASSAETHVSSGRVRARRCNGTIEGIKDQQPRLSWRNLLSLRCSQPFPCQGPQTALDRHQGRTFIELLGRKCCFNYNN